MVMTVRACNNELVSGVVHWMDASNAFSTAWTFLAK